MTSGRDLSFDSFEKPTSQKKNDPKDVFTLEDLGNFSNNDDLFGLEENSFQEKRWKRSSNFLISNTGSDFNLDAEQIQIDTLPFTGLSEIELENKRLQAEIARLKVQLLQRDSTIADLRKQIELLSKPESAKSPSIKNSAALNAKEVLQHQLDSMGFKPDYINKAIQSLQINENETNISSKDEMLEDDLNDQFDISVQLNAALDHLFNMEDQSTDRSFITPPQHKLKLYHEQSISTAGFLRSEKESNQKAPQTDSSRTSTYFNLLLSTERPSEEEIGKENSDQLFSKKDILSSHEQKKNVSTTDNIPPLEYDTFISFIMTPECSDIIKEIRGFIISILGPNGDGTPPSSKQKIEVPFYGITDIETRCRGFFENMQNLLRQHPAWKKYPEEYISQAGNHLEKCVLTKIYPFAYQVAETPEKDRQLQDRMKALSFLPPEALEISSAARNDVVWSIAQLHLKEINNHILPSEKIACIVRCCSVIFSVLNLSRGTDPTTRPGADDFLPIFIYVVLKANVPKLYSNCEYIQKFHNPASLMSKAGYCFVNLLSAIEFIMTMDASVLNIDEEFFNRQLAQYESTTNNSIS